MVGRFSLFSGAFDALAAEFTTRAAVTERVFAAESDADKAGVLRGISGCYVYNSAESRPHARVRREKSDY